MKILDYQLQSTVARLLARENITVNHLDVPTAYFDLKSRSITLPLWKDHGKVVYDMLIAHEVSHALESDGELIMNYIADKGLQGMPDALNVIDDVRIERKIQDKYPGLPKIFKGAYKELVEKDLFKIKGVDLSTLKFIDRLNLHAKIGKIVDVPLSDEEFDFYKRCYNSDTTEDVIALYEEFVANEKEKKQSEGPSPESQTGTPQGDGSSSNSNESGSGSDGEEQEVEKSEASAAPSGDGGEDTSDSGSNSENGEESGEDVDTSEGESSDSGGESFDEIHSDTLRDFNENVVSGNNGTAEYSWEDKRWEAIPTLFPTRENVDRVTRDYKAILKNREETSSFARRHDDIPDFDKGYFEYRKVVKKKVGVLIREFERRQSAFRFSRSRESRVGTIDVNKLHKYRYDDEIFSSVTRLADGKSHGMIFYVDYSGSMRRTLSDVIDQTLNLVHFCKRVGIPFEVYSYTSTFGWGNDHNGNKPVIQDNEINLSEVVINNILSSRMTNTEYRLAFEQLYYQKVALSLNYYLGDSALSSYESLGGTPLNATLLAANYHCNDFQKRNNVDKLNVIVLSDGDSHEANTPKKSSYIAVFEGKKVDIGGRSRGVSKNGVWANVDTQQEKILKLLRKKATVIGMFVPETKTAHRGKISRASGDFDKNMAIYKKEKFINLPETGGYESLMIIPSNLEIKDDTDWEFDSGEDISTSTKSQAALARTFTRVSKSSRKSRIILTKFAELIA